jgi:hypothetical protein
VFHEVRVLKNVTISMDEDLASWLRVEAAKADMSVSRYVAKLLDAKRGAPRMSQSEALAMFLSGPELPGLAEEFRSRDRLYDEDFLSRHKSIDLPARRARPRKTAAG